jgi:hypothetical protein
MLQGVLALGMLACGSAERADRGLVVEGAAVGPVPSHAAVQASSLPGNLDDEAPPEEARSFVDIWRLPGLTMSKSFVHYYQSPNGNAPATIALLYQAHDRAGHWVTLEWPYDGRPVTYSYSDLSVAPSYVALRDDPAQREWRVVAGNVSLEPQADGQMKVALSDLQMAESLAQGEGEPEPLADGFVTGDVERICIEYVTPTETENLPINGATGLPAAQGQRDDDWSSPFCAPFAP